MSAQCRDDMEQWENRNPAEILREIRKYENSEEEGEKDSQKMTETAYHASINKMVEALKEMVGEEISTSRLMNEVYGCSGGREYLDELFQIHEDVVEAAEKAGLILEMSKHENKCEGLPFSLEYLVRVAD